MEIYLCGSNFSIGPTCLVQLTRSSKDSFTSSIYYAIAITITMAIAITIRFKNGLCTHFCHCDPFYPTERIAIVIVYYMADVNEP